jgi:CMP-N,N'-diacetyllegionaminic acid synthase
MLIYVDIDNTICITNGMDYENSVPIFENIRKINELYEKDNQIFYWTARGTVSKIDWYEITLKQLQKWGCKFHKLSVGEKPPYDLLICDRTKRIEEI